MNKNYTFKIANYIIVTLFLILTSLFTYNLYILFNNITAPKSPPRNSIRVSPISGENINVSTPISITKVNYNLNTFEDLGYIENASIVFENFSIADKQLSYSALFHNLDFKLDDSMNMINYETTSSLPNLSFIESSNLNDNNFANSAKKIKVSQDSNISCSFSYYNDKYYRLNNNGNPIILNNKEIVYDNIIINNFNENKTIIFTKGVFKETASTALIQISSGKTYYINLSSTGSYTCYN